MGALGEPRILGTISTSSLAPWPWLLDARGSLQGLTSGASSLAGLGLGGDCVTGAGAACQRGRAAQEDLSQDEINLPISPHSPALSPDLHRFAIHPPSSDAVPAIR